MTFMNEHKQDWTTRQPSNFIWSQFIFHMCTQVYRRWIKNIGAGIEFWFNFEGSSTIPLKKICAWEQCRKINIWFKIFEN